MKVTTVWRYLQCDRENHEHLNLKYVRNHRNSYSSAILTLVKIIIIKWFKKWHNGMVTDKIVVLRTRTVELIGEFWLKNKGYIDPVNIIAYLTYLYLSKALLGKFWTETRSGYYWEHQEDTVSIFLNLYLYLNKKVFCVRNPIYFFYFYIKQEPLKKRTLGCLLSQLKFYSINLKLLCIPKVFWMTIKVRVRTFASSQWQCTACTQTQYKHIN